MSKSEMKFALVMTKVLKISQVQKFTKFRNSAL